MRSLMYLFAMIVVIVLSCCKKEKPLRIRYPEDTQDYDATPVERIANKWWVLDSVSVNGVDYTDTVYNTFGKYSFYLNSEENASNGGTIRKGNVQFSTPFGFVLDSTFYTTTGFECLWGINEFFGVMPLGGFLRKDSIYSFTPYFYYPISQGNIFGWQVLNISDKRFKISATVNNVTVINIYK